MLRNNRRNRRVLAGIAGVNLCLAVAVSAGAVPQRGAGDGDGHSARTVASASSIEQLAAPVRQPGDLGTDMAAVVTTEVPTTVPVTVGPKADVTTGAVKAAPATAPITASPTTRSVAQAPVPPAPGRAPVVAAPVNVARRTPPAGEVQQAISALPNYVRSLLAPSSAQVAQLGDKVCTMFDQGQTFADVKATGLSMVTQIPLTTVLPGGADWVVRTATTLYCPGHLAKIG